MLGYFAGPSFMQGIASFSLKNDPSIAKKSTKGTESTKKTQTIIVKETIDTEDLFGGDESEDFEITTPEEDKEIAVIEDDSDMGNNLIRTIRSESDGLEPAEEPNFNASIKASQWLKPNILKEKFAGKIRAGIGSGRDREKVMAFIKKPENRLMIAQWELLHRSDLDILAAMMKDAKMRTDLEPLLNNLPWVASFVYDGQLEKPEIALSMVYHFRQRDPKMDEVILTENSDDIRMRENIKRDIAGAVAVEYTRNGWYTGGAKRSLSEDEIEQMRKDGLLSARPKKNKKGSVDIYKLARERYLFFAEGVDKQLFNRDFYSLPNWLLRFTCGWKGTSSFGTASTMKWLRDNNSAPVKSYTAFGFQVPYLPSNIFGDVIFSAHYYAPFTVSYPGNFAKMTRDIGAVCGGVSHYGTASANANGIPAFTMGEPGHCAFAIYMDGKWHPCNSIFPKKYPHYPVWGESEWSTMQMYSNMYKQGAITRDAQMLATLGSVLVNKGNALAGLTLFELSVSHQPLNRGVWMEYIKSAAANLKKNPQRWVKVNSFVCEAMAPRNPEGCAKFLRDSIYPTMLKHVRNMKWKQQCFAAYFNNLAKQEDAHWDMIPFLDMQASALGKSAQQRNTYYEMLLNAVGEKPEFASALTWALQDIFLFNKSQTKRFIKLIEKKRETVKNTLLIDAALIRSTEETNDRKQFWKYSADYVKGSGSLPDIRQPARGKIISDKAVISLSTYHEDPSSIVEHAAALNGTGGRIMSEGGKHQLVTIELERATRIGCIQIVPMSSLGSYYEWQVQYSIDGKNWKILTELPERSDKDYLHLEIKRNRPLAKYIRIDSGSDQHVGIKFKTLLIYDDKIRN